MNENVEVSEHTGQPWLMAVLLFGFIGPLTKHHNDTRYEKGNE